MDADVATVAGLFADRTRAAALALLVGGTAHTAGELARAAGVPASTMAGHLTKLLQAGAVAVAVQGRHRYYRLADPRLAAVWEALAAAAPAGPAPSSLRQWRRSRDLKHARTCYDHLAGEVAVSITAALVARGDLVPDGEAYDLTAPGERRLTGAGVDVGACRARRRRFAYPCLDWSERTAHLGGALGAGLLATATASGWLRTRPGERAVGITDAGRYALAEHFGHQEQAAATRPASRTTRPPIGTRTRGGSTRSSGAR